MVGDVVVGAIDRGLLVYLGAEKDDGPSDLEYLAGKVANLRIFEGDDGKTTHAVADVRGAVLVVSQFTLFGDVRRGRRHSFDDAAPPEDAERLYEGVCAALRALGLPIQTGQFRAHMVVRSEGDGPVTILLDSRKRF